MFDGGNLVAARHRRQGTEQPDLVEGRSISSTSDSSGRGAAVTVAVPAAVTVADQAAVAVADPAGKASGSSPPAQVKIAMQGSKQEAVAILQSAASQSAPSQAEPAAVSGENR